MKTHIVGAPESAKDAAATAASSSFLSALTHEKALLKRIDKKKATQIQHICQKAMERFIQNKEKIITQSVHDKYSVLPLHWRVRSK